MIGVIDIDSKPPPPPTFTYLICLRRSSSSSGCSSSATCELYDLATAHALLARQHQLIQHANFPIISSADFVQQLAHHQQLQQLQNHIQGIVHHNLISDMALVSHPATAATVGAAPMYGGSVVKQDKKPQPTPHQVLQMQQQQQLPQDKNTQGERKTKKKNRLCFFWESCLFTASHVSNAILAATQPFYPAPVQDTQPDRPIGYGAFGVVWSVTDPRSGKRVALKKMPNVFQNLASCKRVLCLLDILQPTNPHFFQEL
ncbi:hypothetical protein DICVIV_09651 [Dictyocaulus viviparus]|uniref:Protein kinase domain-containing protein n=1 Tax=Dictyocaulus viviparus TaxID=29172 RepID=A0A0D8XI32_DICVI|nr:hypothetical protein DICVIV_09651 [Dictyocaulus viviparus]